MSLCHVASRRLDGVGALRHAIAAPSLITITTRAQILEVFDGRGKKDKKGNYPGLYLDDVIYGV